MPEFKVVSAVKTGEYETKFGKMFKYAVQFENEADGVELSQKPDTPAPANGAILSGTIETTQYGKRFKKEQKNFGGPSGGTPGVSNKQVALAEGIKTADTYFSTLAVLDPERAKKEFPKTILEMVGVQNALAVKHLKFMDKPVEELTGEKTPVQRVSDVMPGAEEVADGAKEFDKALGLDVASEIEKLPL